MKKSWMLRHRVFKIDSSDNEQMNKDRIERAYDPKLDSIRIIACLAVVLLHVSARPIYMQKELSQWGWMLGNAVSSLTHWCVPVFVMLSGALVLGDKRTTYPYMLVHRVPRMLVVLAISSIIYALWMFFFQHAFEWKAFTRDLLMGMPYCHLHFFYLIIGLYIIVPSISQAVIAMDEKHVRNAAVVACLISAVTFFWSVWTRAYSPNGGSFSWGYWLFYSLILYPSIKAQSALCNYLPGWLRGYVVTWLRGYGSRGGIAVVQDCRRKRLEVVFVHLLQSHRGGHVDRYMGLGRQGC
ncbi:acyltransferase family protein [Paracidovorax citrulli]|uniref:acyltransferase n=2 Tax=Paracidovorax citrulli TaxID=80869 RepID=UPI0011C058A6|nr:acyltransferase family protein [Paracidovorax citrulli]UMT95245.1 acyltransferase family protein [Paracidovorax citrulli]